VRAPQVSQTHSPPLGKRCITGTYGESLCIVNGSAVTITADALVNAANEALSNGGGIAREFINCGGRCIQEQCNEIVKKNGRIPTTENAVTCTGCLHATDLINAVGPIFDKGDPGRSMELLESTMYNIIRTARMLCDETVAVPLVSGGIFGFGAENSAAALTKAVLEFYYYWYWTEFGSYSQQVIDHAVNTTRFIPPRKCTGMYPKKISIVAYYPQPDDYAALNKSMNDCEALLASWRSKQVRRICR
jgi:O-acetyl-ADP-ribose deacetylase (regulator of RNase III)